MEITLRELVTSIHGMLFGGFFLMALFGALVLLLDWNTRPLWHPLREFSVRLLWNNGNHPPSFNRPQGYFRPQCRGYK